MREEIHGIQSEYIPKKLRPYYEEGDTEAISGYCNLVRKYIKENPGITRTELYEIVRKNQEIDVPSSFFEHVSIDNFISKTHTHQGVEKTFSNEECFNSLKEAFKYLCDQEAKKLGKVELSPEEKRKFKFKEIAYEKLRKDKIFEHIPSSNILVHRFGPYWENVLQKSGLF